MYKTFYEGMHTTAPLLALALFGLTFIAIVLRTMVFTKSSDFTQRAELPLENDGARHES